MLQGRNRDDKAVVDRIRDKQLGMPEIHPVIRRHEHSDLDDHCNTVLLAAHFCFDYVRYYMRENERERERERREKVMSVKERLIQTHVDCRTQCECHLGEKV